MMIAFECVIIVYLFPEASVTSVYKGYKITSLCHKANESASFDVNDIILLVWLLKL